MEIVPGRHPLSTADFYTPSDIELSAPARAESEPSIHSVCVTTRLRPRVAACHLGARSGNWPSESARLIVRRYVREAGNFLLLWRRDSKVSPEGIETPDGSLFLHVARLTLELPRWDHEGGPMGCGIGTTSHTTVEFTAVFFWRCASSGKRRVFFSLFFRTEEHEKYKKIVSTGVCFTSRSSARPRRYGGVDERQHLRVSDTTQQRHLAE